ncbi:hypothetical protein BURMUCGD1_6659 [Burkholderia multivorans CGD1]|nr:hypothetical protein BURMUCGD1_6659 [Burkholderia multivorans CGD1]
MRDLSAAENGPRLIMQACEPVQRSIEIGLAHFLQSRERHQNAKRVRAHPIPADLDLFIVKKHRRDVEPLPLQTIETPARRCIRRKQQLRPANDGQLRARCAPLQVIREKARALMIGPLVTRHFQFNYLIHGFSPVSAHGGNR